MADMIDTEAVARADMAGGLDIIHRRCILIPLRGGIGPLHEVGDLTMKSTDFRPSKKFLATIAHKTPMQQARAIAAWQQKRLLQEIDKIDIGLVADGVDTGSLRARIRFNGTL